MGPVSTRTEQALAAGHLHAHVPGAEVTQRLPSVVLDSPAAVLLVDLGSGAVTDANALAAQLAAGPTKVLGMSKRLLNQSFETDINRSLAEEGLLQALATTTADLREGMNAFREKRDPDYTGR